MSEKTIYIPFHVMDSFIIDVFKKIGVPKHDAKICADVLVTADKRGIDSHGVGRLKPIYYDRIVKDKTQTPKTKIEILKNKMATAVVDGHNGMGMVIAKKCMELAIKKAKKYGVGFVAAKNSNHYGIASYYPLMAVNEGMIGLSGTNARPSIAPTFGVENMLGTNPVVFAFPTDEDFPFTNDYATSITQRGKIEQYAREGKEMPFGWVIDRDGNSKTDPLEVLKDLINDKAALCPLGGIGEDSGGYKGYGFATVTEILSAALTNGAFLKMLSGFNDKGEKIPYRLGHYFMAVNISFFTEVSAFKKTAGDILRALRNSKKAKNENRIYTCGEKEYIAWCERKDKGIPVNDKVMEDILAMRNELKLKKYKF